jgi:ribosomal protein S18 acetylase RimI-like enzyme
MTQIREMSGDDFDYALELTNLMRWDYSRRDFEWMIYFEPKGCFIATDGDKRIGITTTIAYKNLGWIGNVITSPEYRRRDIGSELIDHSIDYLENKSIDFIGLYSYPDTSKFYTGLGFKEDERFVELSGRGRSHSFEECGIMTSKDLEFVVELDSKCFGASRKKILAKIFDEFKDLCWLTVTSGEVAGYIMGTESATGVEIGPWICDPKNNEKALNLLRALLCNTKGMKLSLGVPARNLELINKLKKLKFEVDFEVLRMFYKGKKPMMRENFILAVGSLDRG